MRQPALTIRRRQSDVGLVQDSCMSARFDVSSPNFAPQPGVLMTTFVPVQVPEHLVLDVYRFIADRDGALILDASAKNDEARDWTLEELTLLAESDATSVQLMAKVLTILLEAAPNPLSIDEVGAKVEMEGLTIQK